MVINPLELESVAEMTENKKSAAEVKASKINDLAFLSSYAVRALSEKRISRHAYDTLTSQITECLKRYDDVNDIEDEDSREKIIELINWKVSLLEVYFLEVVDKGEDE